MPAMGRIGSDASFEATVTFGGYTKDAYNFFDELEENNNREWWLAHKNLYEEHVAGPTRALADSLKAEHGPAHVFRPNRDVRFSNDKSPYKLAASFVIDAGAGTGIYVQLAQGGVFIGGGLYDPRSDQLLRWRQLFDDPSLTKRVEKALNSTKAAGFELSRDAAVKTAPRGWDRSHPKIDLIRLKNAVIGRSFEPEATFDASFLDTTLDAARSVASWNELIAQLVGPSNLPDR